MGKCKGTEYYFTDCSIPLEEATGEEEENECLVEFVVQQQSRTKSGSHCNKSVL